MFCDRGGAVVESRKRGVIMTESEAIRVLKDFDAQVTAKADGAYQTNIGKMACDAAIKALEEVQQYRAVGTVEECREAVEKQKAKKPDYEGDGYSDGQLVYDTWICPCCGKHYEVDCDRYDYCPECGQHIDKSMEQEGKR